MWGRLDYSHGASALEKEEEELGFQPVSQLQTLSNKHSITPAKEKSFSKAPHISHPQMLSMILSMLKEVPDK